jgi:hypothetical protein
VAHLVPAARAARTTLTRDGRSLSRDNVADAMRDDGHGVSNERVSLPLKIVKAEQDVTTISEQGHCVLGLLLVTAVMRSWGRWLARRWRGRCWSPRGTGGT